MNTSNEKAMRLALEALKTADWYIDQLEMIVYSADDLETHHERAKVQAVIKAIEEALAKQEQGEPVAWVVYSSSENDIVWANKGKRLKQNTPLYTTPQQRTWVGLTDDEKADIAAQGHQRWKEYAEAIEAKLKEKNT